MAIILKSLHLVNFKGARDVELSFNPGTTLVSGDNGTGKTTVFDAFTWLLFGKDSTNRSDSNFCILRNKCCWMNQCRCYETNLIELSCPITPGIFITDSN